MVKQNLIDHLTFSCGLQRASAIRAVEGIIQAVSSALASGESVALRGLGTLKVRNVPQKTARNVKTGEPVIIPAHLGVKFIPAGALKESLSNIPANE